jgi:predicted  nucleic acid-binding Zn-ribbon protein
MSVAKQLYQLQEIDLESEASEQTLSQLSRQVGDNRVVVEAQDRLTLAQQQLAELKRRQRSAEGDIDDLVTKITAVEKQLYGGRIMNPKELSSLQHEVELLKAKRDQLETKALEIMDQVESTEASVTATTGEFNKLEAEWHQQQQQLSTDIEALKSKLSDLKEKRQRHLAEIDSWAVTVYDTLRKQKGQAVVRIEQGICRGCRISLSVSELQQARSGNLVQCSSCGRILFLP